MSYNPAADSTIATPGKKRKRSEENGETAPGHSIPVTPSVPAKEEGLCPVFSEWKNLEHKLNVELELKKKNYIGVDYDQVELIIIGKIK